MPYCLVPDKWRSATSGWGDGRKTGQYCHKILNKKNKHVFLLFLKKQNARAVEGIS